MAKLGNGGKGIGWNTEHEVDFLEQLNGVVTDEGATKGCPGSTPTSTPAEVILQPGAGDQRRGRGEGLGVARQASPAASTRISRIPKEDEKIRFRDVVGAAAQDHLLADLVRAGVAKRSATTPATPTCTS